MGKIFQLVKIMRKCDRGGKAEKSMDAAADTTKYVAIVIVVVLMGILGFNITRILGDSSSGLVMQSIFVLVSVAIAVISVPKFINTLFMSTDITSYLVLPCKPSQITTAKLIVIAISNYTFFIGLSVPFLIGYGISSSQSVSFWIGSITLILTIPAVVLSVMGIFVMLLIRFVPFARNKDAVSVMGVVLTLLVTVAYFVVTMNSNNITVQNTLDIVGTILRTMSSSSIIVPIIPLGGMIIDDSAYYLIPLIFLIAAAFVGIYMLVANAFYLKTALRITVGSGSGKKLDLEGIAKQSKKKSVLHAYTVKELKILFRTPSFVLNGVIMSFLYPGFLCGSALITLMQMSFIFEAAGTGNDIFIFMINLIFVALTSIFAVSFNNSALISISREGQSFFIMKTIPIPYKTQIKAKRNATLLITGASSLLYAIAMSIVSVVMFKSPVWHAAFMLVYSVIMAIIIVDVQMIFAMKKPNLVWESDAQLNKNDSGAILYVLLIAVVIGAATFAAVYFPMVWGMEIPTFVLAIIIIAFLVLVSIAVNRQMYRFGNKKLIKL